MSSNSGWLSCTLRIVHIIQMIIQGQWLNQSDLLTIPHVTRSSLSSVRNAIVRQCHSTGYNISTLFGLRLMTHSQRNIRVENIFMEVFSGKSSVEAKNFIYGIPVTSIAIRVAGLKSILNLEEPYTISADANIDFEIDLHRAGPEDRTVQSKKFPKQKDESWILLLGIPDDDALLAMKRVTIKRTASVNLQIKAPERKGKISFFQGLNVEDIVFLQGSVSLVSICCAIRTWAWTNSMNLK